MPEFGFSDRLGLDELSLLAGFQASQRQLFIPVLGPLFHRGRLQGSGLGLAIAREFVVAHGGRIEVVRDLAAGAHFRVTLAAGTSSPES